MEKSDKLLQLERVSDIRKVIENLINYLGTDYKLYVSTRYSKKYMIYDKEKQKFIHFGSIYYRDFTKTRDEKQRQRYLKRANGTRGNWRQNKLSPQMLAIHLLWM